MCFLRRGVVGPDAAIIPVLPKSPEGTALQATPGALRWRKRLYVVLGLRPFFRSRPIRLLLGDHELAELPRVGG